MTEKISLEAVEKTAALAHLAMDRPACVALQKQLSAVLDWVASLDKAEAELASVPVFDPLECLYQGQEGRASMARDDMPDTQGHPSRIQSMSSTTQAQHDYFTVPPVIE